MKQPRLLAEQQDRHCRPEHRHQMKERRGAVRTDQREAAVEKQVRQRGWKDHDIDQRRQRQRVELQRKPGREFPDRERQQPVVKAISDSWCVFGRRGISAEYRPNNSSAPANITSPLLNWMPASAPGSPRRMMVSTPASEVMMPASCAHVSRAPNNSSDHTATNSGPDDWISSAFSAWVYCSAQ